MKAGSSGRGVASVGAFSRVRLARRLGMRLTKKLTKRLGD